MDQKTADAVAAAVAAAAAAVAVALDGKWVHQQREFPFLLALKEEVEMMKEVEAVEEVVVELQTEYFQQ